MTESGAPAEAGELWVDVATLLGWQGKFTGIPRTMAELLYLWLRQPGLPLRLCRYDAAERAFLEVPRPALAQVLDVHRASWPDFERDPPRPAPAPPPPRRPPLRARLKGALRPAFRALPLDVQHSARYAYAAGWHLGRGAACGVRALAGLARGAARPLCEAAGLPPARAPFGPADTLLLMGGGWEQPGLCEALWWLKRSVGLRLVPLLYDVIPAKLPQFCDPRLPPLFGRWVRKLLCLSDLVLTISENSRADLIELAGRYGNEAPPVAVLRLGDELPPARATRPEGLPGWVDGPFVLSVGTVEARKNHYLLYHLWRRLTAEHGRRVPTLVWAGQTGWLTGELLYQVVADPLTRERVLQLASVNDAELRWLYRHCQFTLYPSHYEGWGLPVAEALAHGKYCVASSTSSLPEVGGPLVDYCDPLDLPGWQERVERALFEPAYVPGREACVRACFRPTPWSACADQVLAALRRPAAEFRVEAA